MISLVCALPALLTIGAAGFGASTWLLRDAARLRIFEVAAISWLFGTAIVSFALWVVGGLLRGMSLHITVTIVCVILGIYGVFLCRSRPIRWEISRPKNAAEWMLMFLLSIEMAAIFYIVFKHTLGWDGLLIWEMKARYSFLNGGALPMAYFVDAGRAYSHPEYPLFLSLTEMWLYLWMGECNQFWVKLIFPIFYMAGMILLVQAAAEVSGRRWIGLLIASLFPLVPFVYHFPGGIIVGYADLPLSFFYLAAIYYLCVFTGNNSKQSLILFVTAAAILPWVKREGLILWLVEAGWGAGLIWRRRNLQTAILSLVPGVLVAAAWRIFLHNVHAQAPLDFVPVSAHVLYGNISRLTPVVLRLIENMSSLDRWSLFWYATATALICVMVRHRCARAAIVIVGTVIPIGLYCATYLFSAWPEFLAHVDSSLPRLLLQLVPVGWLIIAMAIAPTRKTA